MSTEDAEQLALDGLAPRKRRKRASTPKTPAAEHPIAQVVLDIQATHLGQTFDYYVEEKYSEDAQPGVMVRVRFRRATGQRHRMEQNRHQRNPGIVAEIHRTSGLGSCAGARVHAE